MKRFLVSALLLGIALSPDVAHATGIISGDQVRLVSSTGTLGGGGFTVDGPGSIEFLTFCIEINEHVNYNTPYYANIAMVAVNGGAGPPGDAPDPLDHRTAYLYSNFLNGAGYNADALQLALWLIEQEVYIDGGQYKRADNHNVMGNATMWTQANALFANANTNAVAGNFYGIAVMQLWTGYTTNPDGTKTFTGNRQDQLIQVPDATSSFYALLVGVALLGVARMRFGG